MYTNGYVAGLSRQIEGKNNNTEQEHYLGKIGTARRIFSRDMVKPQTLISGRKYRIQSLDYNLFNFT